MRKILASFVVDVAKAFFSAGAAQAGINIANRVAPPPPETILVPEPEPEPEKKRVRPRRNR